MLCIPWSINGRVLRLLSLIGALLILRRQLLTTPVAVTDVKVNGARQHQRHFAQGIARPQEQYVERKKDAAAACDLIPVAIDHEVFIVLKTGATELHQRLPAQLSSMLRCIRNIEVFSDREERFLGVTIRDALKEVALDVRTSHQDFELYRQLQQHGLTGVRATEPTQQPVNRYQGNLGNAGWKLDKWKFLPIVDEMVRLQPDAKWYFLIETDTYISWPNLARWLARLDASKAEYIGFPMQIGPTIFAYGGSGILISNPAAHRASAQHLAHISELDAYTDREWAGDCVLGKVMTDAGVSLHWSWPLSYIDSIADLEPTQEMYDKRLWCHPIVGLHHMKPDEIQDLWAFEQDWSRHHPDRVLLFQDLFRQYILPMMANIGSETYWDNLSTDQAGDRESGSSLEECEAACRRQPGCLQFSHADGRCRTSPKARLGRADPAHTARSGWMLDRIRRYFEDLPECVEDIWV